MVFNLIIISYLILFFVFSALIYVGVHITLRPILKPKERKTWVQIRQRTIILFCTGLVTSVLLFFLHPIQEKRDNLSRQAYFVHECSFNGYPENLTNEYYLSGAENFCESQAEKRVTLEKLNMSS